MKSPLRIFIQKCTCMSKTLVKKTILLPFLYVYILINYYFFLFFLFSFLEGMS